MNKKTSRKRPQNQKPNKHANPAMYRAMMELRQSSAAEPHRNRSRYDRRDFRAMAQRGVWE
jgi:hypothetical protein